MTRFATFVIMLAFWVVMSGMFDGFHLTLGVICCALVAHFSHRLLFFGSGQSSPLRQTFGLLGYLPWLFYQIVLSSVDVMKIVLHPRMLDLIDPQVIHFKTQLKGSLAKATFAQSITLTPGTITVSTHDDEFTVYALTRAGAESLPGEMEQRVKRALEGGV
ncbi:MAG: Na+/H+ antiporter subunit E [Trichloromonadaceae bacterium]